ncbi:MAG: FtsX-like permease family protein [Phycisphaerales bacterium]|nr:FtsX-like permease family protein [Phycisphaerales bacterium]
MGNVFKIAARNLMRYRRRTLLTSALVVLGIVAVMVFVAVAGSFKAMMVGQITDSMLGHVQVHRRGYVASIDSLPINLNMPPELVERVGAALTSTPGVAVWTPRVKFGAGFSNFAETTNIRVVGIDPDREIQVTPLSASRVRGGRAEGPFLQRGEILVPALLVRGMAVKPGDSVVLIATNKDGSVNGKTLVVRGELDSVTGPGGRDGYIHIDDARELLRMTSAEVSEIAIRLKAPEAAEQTADALRQTLGAVRGKKKDGGAGMGLEVHPWQMLTPFNNIAKMIDMMTLFIKIMLVSIVLISVMNVMVMAVYERIREIGTISAIGTPPRRVLSLFVAEGLILGVLGAVLGTALSVGAILAINAAQFTYDFGQQQGIVMSATIAPQDVLTISIMAILVAVVASLQPAWKASRMDPVQALRHV